MKNFLIILSFIICINSFSQVIEFNHKDVCFWNSEKKVFDDCSEDDLTSRYVLDSENNKIYFNEFGEEFIITYYKIINKENVFEYVVSDVSGEEFVVTIPKDKSYLKIIYVNVGIKTSLIYKNNF